MKPSQQKFSTVQGEGDSTSIRKNNEHVRSFAESGKAERAAREAASRDAREQDTTRRPQAKGGDRPEQAPGSRRRDDIEKRAPGKHPPGRNPTPEKLPGR